MKNSDEQKRIVRTKIPKTKNVQNHKVAEEAIRQRANEIFLTKGGEPGHELDDRLQAEGELSP
jgi:hypothetical protein